MASPRRLGREVALQILCALDANPEQDARAGIALYLAHLCGAEEEEGDLPSKQEFDQAFTEDLVRKVAEHRNEIDRLIGQVSRTWRPERMARVDRNIIRLAVGEMKYVPDIPTRVTINEAVELAKRYGAAESPAFVNGLLDSAAKALEGPK